MPYVETVVCRDILRGKCVKCGDVFDAPPLLAIKQKGDRKYVEAIGHSVVDLGGQDIISVHNPFESLEPVFSELDLSEAIFKHALREAFGARWRLSPRVALALRGRTSPLSSDERNMVSYFAYSCGIERFYIFLGDQSFAVEDEFSHGSLSIHASDTIKSIQR